MGGAAARFTPARGDGSAREWGRGENEADGDDGVAGMHGFLPSAGAGPAALISTAAEPPMPPPPAGRGPSPPRPGGPAWLARRGPAQRGDPPMKGVHTYGGGADSQFSPFETQLSKTHVHLCSTAMQPPRSPGRPPHREVARRPAPPAGPAHASRRGCGNGPTMLCECRGCPCRVVLHVSGLHSSAHRTGI